MVLFLYVWWIFDQVVIRPTYKRFPEAGAMEETSNAAEPTVWSVNISEHASCTQSSKSICCFLTIHQHKKTFEIQIAIFSCPFSACGFTKETTKYTDIYTVHVLVALCLQPVGALPREAPPSWSDMCKLSIWVSTWPGSCEASALVCI